jgi:hypothetical protein
MALETGTYVNDLVITNPTPTDPKSQGDDHLRLIKTVLKDSFSGISGGILIGGTDTGAANSYVMTNSPALTKYSNFLTLLLKIANSNTGASVINVDGLGSVSITRTDGSATQANDLRAGQVVILSYISGAFQLVAAATVSVPSANNVAGGTAGAILNQSAPGATQFLSLGAANQVVGVNNAGTSLENKTISNGTGAKITNTAGEIFISGTTLPSLVVCEQQPSNTPGGTATVGAWTNRVLNTTIYNTISGASLASNVISLPAGTYDIDASMPTSSCQHFQGALYNQTASAFVVVGTSELSASNTQTRSFIQGRFTLATTSSLAIRYYCSSSFSTNDLGDAVGSGQVETYTIAKITQVLS